MTDKLTLAQIAAIYHTSPKTFKRLVARCGIPHELLGTHMRFDPVKVARCLEARSQINNNVIKMPLPTKPVRGKVKSKFAEALGI